MSTKKPLKNASAIIDRFGGIRPMSAKIDVPVTTIQGWKKRDTIPANRREQILKAAEESNIDLSDLLWVQQVTEGSDKDPLSDSSPATKPETPAQKSSDNERPEPPITETAAISSQRAIRSEPEAARSGAVAADEETERRLEELRGTMVTRSFLASAAGAVVVIGLAALLFWPQAKEVADVAPRVDQLESRVAEVEDAQGNLRNGLATSLKERIETLQAQTQNVQQKVEDFKAQAENFAGTFLGDGAFTDRIAALEEKVAQFSGSVELSDLLVRVRNLEQTVEGQESLTAMVDDLRNVVFGVEGRVNDLDQALAEAQKDQDALGETLQGIRNEDLQAAALLIGLSQFRDSLNRSAPLEDDLALLQTLIGKDNQELNESIERLSPHAQHGVLTPDGLSNELKALAGDIVVASVKGEDVSIKDKALARLSEVVSIEKDGEMVLANDTQARINKAQAYLDEGNVAAALSELQSLEGESQQVAAPVIDAAQATLMAQNLQGLLSKAVTRKFSSGGAPYTAGGSGNMRGLNPEFKSLPSFNTKADSPPIP